MLLNQSSRGPERTVPLQREPLFSFPPQRARCCEGEGALAPLTPELRLANLAYAGSELGFELKIRLKF